MANKRTLHQDPEYAALPSEVQEKRIKIIEDNVRKQTQQKIEQIIKSNIEQEITKKEEEIDAIDELLYESQCTLDRLRACVITKYYATLGQEQALSECASTSIHPAVKKYLGKTPKYSTCDVADNLNAPSTSKNSSETNRDKETGKDFSFQNESQLSSDSSKKVEDSVSATRSEDISLRGPRFKKKCKLVVGNISKFIPIWQRDGSDQSTHKWMVYVRGDKENPHIESFVKKVRFLLHPSYKPSDIVEISNPPFHLIKRGWGEFPVRVQLHFHDSRNKPVDIIHNLKLDKTFTGLQTLGAETVAEIQLFKNEEPKINFSDSSLSESRLISSSSKAATITCNGISSEDQTPLHKQPDTNVHTIIKQDPDSLVMKLKLNNIVNSTAIDVSSNVNKSNSDSKIDSKKSSEPSEKSAQVKIVPKIVISKNTVVNKNSPVITLKKSVGVSNGLSAFVKCKDKDGRVLLVPQTSLSFKAADVSKQNCVPQDSGKPENKLDGKVVNKTVPSYILKVVPNKDSGQNQVFLIPVSDKKPTAEKETEIKTASSIEPSIGDTQTPSVTAETFIKKVHPINQEQELKSIKLEYYKSFEELLKRICKVFPLVKSGVDHVSFPYCANTVEEFQRWNLGKQRACEWRRAGKIRKAILSIIAKNPNCDIKPESVWSQSFIMTWCRKNGFVPMMTEKMTFLPEPKWSGIELCSLTNADDLVYSLKEEKSNVVESDDEEIEILEVVDKKEPNICKNEPQKDIFHLPHLTESAPYVKHLASQLGVEIKPIEIEPNLYVPAVEEVILAACRELASDLIGAALNEGYNRLGGRLCPEEVTVSDVYSAVKKIPHFDFLTNSFLGVPKNIQGNT